MFRRREQQLLRILEREREAFAAERQRLVDVICNLSGKPWTLPPRPITENREPQEDPFRDLTPVN